MKGINIMKKTTFKKVKCTFSALLSALMCIGIIFSTPISAASFDETVKEETVYQLNVNNSARASEDPVELFDLKSGNVYNAIISQLAVGWGTKTMYYFNTTGSIYLHYSLNNANGGNSNRTLNVELYEGGPSSWRLAQMKTVTFSETANGTVQFSGLDKNINYYIRFYNATSRNFIWESKDINGNVRISNTYI